MCKNVYKYNKNALSNLNKHKCYELFKNVKENELIEPTQEAKKSCTKKILFLYLANFLQFY